MKPLVGVMPLWDDKKESIWMLPGYMDAITHSGGIPFIFPLSADKEDVSRLMDLCDGFLFTGGQDVHPDIYEEKPLNGLSDYSRERDILEEQVLYYAIENGRPLLGICRGIQYINAMLGGTLYQDIPSQYPSEIEHHQHPPYDIPVHKVEIIKESPLYRCLNTQMLSVNSCHHQAVKTVSDKLDVMAVSTDGLIEAVYMPGHPFLWGVQWHPEYSYNLDTNSKKIFSKFINAMR